MKISRKSWHYKLINKHTSDFRYGDTIQLCPYMRALFTAMFMYSVAGLFLLAIAFVAIAPLLTYFLPVAVGFDVCIISALIWIGSGVLLRFWAVEEYEGKNPVLFDLSKDVKEREPNIFEIWIKALHEKVCPVMKVED